MDGCAAAVTAHKGIWEDRFATHIDELLPLQDQVKHEGIQAPSQQPAS
jgi:hypothetical protein